MDERNWRVDAACKDSDPEIFFPVATAGQVAEKQMRAAKVVCWTCPVRAECLEDALASGQDYGIWGGVSETDRRLIAKKQGRRRPARKVPASFGRRKRARASA